VQKPAARTQSDSLDNQMLLLLLMMMMIMLILACTCPTSEQNLSES